MESPINRLIPADELHVIDGKYGVISEEELDRILELTEEMPSDKKFKAVKDFEMAKLTMLLFKQFMLGNIGLEFDDKNEPVFTEKW